MWSNPSIRMDPFGRYFTPYEPPCFVSGAMSGASNLPTAQSRSLSQSFSSEQCQIFGAIYEPPREPARLADPSKSVPDEFCPPRKASGPGNANSETDLIRGNNYGAATTPAQVSQISFGNNSIGEGGGGGTGPDIGNLLESISLSSPRSKYRNTFKFTDNGFSKHGPMPTNTSFSFPPYRGRRLSHTNSSHPRMGFPWTKSPSTNGRDGLFKPSPLKAPRLRLEIPPARFSKVDGPVKTSFVPRLPDSDIFGPGGFIQYPRNEDFRPRFDPDFGYVDGFAWNSPRIPSQSFGAYGHPTEAKLSAMGYISQKEADAKTVSFASTTTSVDSGKTDMKTSTSPSSIGMDFPFNPRPKQVHKYAHCSCCHEILWDVGQLIALHCCKTGVHVSCYCLGLDLNRGIFMCPICGKQPEISYGASNILEAAAERNPNKHEEEN